MTATQTAGGFAALDGLPKPFVNAMRTLFDIMDDQRTGYVKFSGWFSSLSFLFYVDLDFSQSSSLTIQTFPLLCCLNKSRF